MSTWIGMTSCCDACGRKLFGEANSAMVLVTKVGAVFCSTCTDLALRQVESEGKKSSGNGDCVTSEKAKNGASMEDAASR